MGSQSERTGLSAKPTSGTEDAVQTGTTMIRVSLCWCLCLCVWKVRDKFTWQHKNCLKQSNYVRLSLNQVAYWQAFFFFFFYETMNYLFWPKGFSLWEIRVEVRGPLQKISVENVRCFGLVKVKGLVEAAQRGREGEARGTLGNLTTSP